MTSALSHPPQQGSSSPHTPIRTPTHGPSDDDEEEDDEQEEPHAYPTKIPYILVTLTIFLTYVGYFVSHFILEDRPEVLYQGNAAFPYELPTFLQNLPSSSSPQAFILPPIIRTVLTYLYFFLPFNNHPLQWVTFTAISLCFLISFIRVRTTDPGDISKLPLPIWSFHQLPPPQQHHMAFNTAQLGGRTTILPLAGLKEKKHHGGVRYCQKTQQFKPDRAHYCAATHRVVSRLDHYCIFLYSTVGYHNHKFFFIWLIHLILLAAFIATKYMFALHFLSNISTTTHFVVNMLLSCVSIAVSIALVFFLAFHMYLIANSLTTLEFNEKYNQLDARLGVYRPTPFDMGWEENFRQVFGQDHFVWWLLPTIPTRHQEEDGTIFNSNKPHFLGYSS